MKIKSIIFQPLFICLIWIKFIKTQKNVSITTNQEFNDALKDSSVKKLIIASNMKIDGTKEIIDTEKDIYLSNSIYFFSSVNKGFIITRSKVNLYSYTESKGYDNQTYKTVNISGAPVLFELNNGSLNAICLENFKCEVGDSTFTQTIINAYNHSIISFKNNWKFVSKKKGIIINNSFIKIQSDKDSFYFGTTENAIENGIVAENNSWAEIIGKGTIHAIYPIIGVNSRFIINGNNFKIISKTNTSEYAIYLKNEGEMDLSSWESNEDILSNNIYNKDSYIFNDVTIEGTLIIENTQIQIGKYKEDNITIYPGVVNITTSNLNAIVLKNNTSFETGISCFGKVIIESKEQSILFNNNTYSYFYGKLHDFSYFNYSLKFTPNYTSEYNSYFIFYEDARLVVKVQNNATIVPFEINDFHLNFNCEGSTVNFYYDEYDKNKFSEIFNSSYSNQYNFYSITNNSYYPLLTLIYKYTNISATINKVRIGFTIDELKKFDGIVIPDNKGEIIETSDVEKYVIIVVIVIFSEIIVGIIVIWSFIKCNCSDQKYKSLKTKKINDKDNKIPLEKNDPIISNK